MYKIIIGKKGERKNRILTNWNRQKGSRKTVLGRMLIGKKEGGTNNLMIESSVWKRVLQTYIIVKNLTDCKQYKKQH